jgi:hypothetical protein
MAVYIIIAHVIHSSSRTDDFSVKVITDREERKLSDKSRWGRRSGSKSKGALRVICDDIVESENSLDGTLPLFKDLLATDQAF